MKWKLYIEYIKKEILEKYKKKKFIVLFKIILILFLFMCAIKIRDEINYKIKIKYEEKIEILDTTTKEWREMDWKKQKEIAEAYQIYYARKYGLEVEKVITVNNVNFYFRLIPPAKFYMGYNKKLHKVIITRPYYLGKYEVTQEQWEAIMGNNPSYFKKSGKKAPVENVSWYDCKKYMEKLGELTGLKFEFPTEAEWEFACRSGTTTRFYWGDDVGYKEIGKYAWYYDNSSHRTHEIGLKKPNGFGLYDMSGNVWEWCYDWYAIGGWVDKYGIFCGGSWSSKACRCRSASCDGGVQSNSWSWVGFRLKFSLVPLW